MPLVEPPTLEAVLRDRFGLEAFRPWQREAIEGVLGDPGRVLVVAPTGGRIASGAERIRRLVRVDQKPIGRTPRSNLATYTGLFDAVRKVFASTDQARARGWTPGRFSFNMPAGRCPTCQGEGFVAVELLFLPGTYAPCQTCHGARYNAETLEVTDDAELLGLVHELDLTKARRWFTGIGSCSILEPLTDLTDLGLLEAPQ